jgi:exodeoxyribonuclease-3
LPRIATWNVNSLRARLDHVVRWLDSARPDVLAVQETKVEDTQFPQEAFARLGYHLSLSGQKTYNGVAVFSREAPRQVMTDNPFFSDPQRRTLAVAFADCLVLDVYVPNGAEVGSEKYAYKLAWLEGLRRWLETLLAAQPRLVLLGDFNVAPDDRDVHDPVAWREKILCSTPERDALKSLLSLGLTDTFRLHEPAGGHYSWWDYRAAGFRRNLGLRIDLILASAPLAGRCTRTEILREPRGWERPSDHAPVMADFDH